MANIRKHGSKWQAQVRREGHPPLVRSFSLKADADARARQRAVEIERGDSAPVDRRALAAVTSGHLLADTNLRFPEQEGAFVEVCRLLFSGDHVMAWSTTI